METVTEYQNNFTRIVKEALAQDNGKFLYDTMMQYADNERQRKDSPATHTPEQIIKQNIPRYAGIYTVEYKINRDRELNVLSLRPVVANEELEAREKVLLDLLQCNIKLENIEIVSCKFEGKVLI